MADGGVISVPVGMAIGGAVLGGAMDSDNPMRGAALGALGGYTGGAAMGAMGAGAAGTGSAAGMGGSLGSGLTAGGGMAGAAEGGAMMAGGLGGSLPAGMSAAGGLGGGLSAGGGTGLAGSGGLLGGSGVGMAGMGAGISAPTSLLGMSAGEAAPGLSLAGHMGKFSTAMQSPEMAEKALGMGGQMLMKDQQAKQGQPVMPGVAPPMMRPQFGAPSFMASAPSFRPAISGLTPTQQVAANPRMRG